MTTRRLALAWATGATAGVLIGWVYGAAVRDLATFRRLRRAGSRPGAPQTPSGHVGTVDHPIGPQAGTQPCEHQRRVDITTYDDLPTRRQACTDCGVTIPRDLRDPLTEGGPMTLTEFLLARIAEDEAVAQAGDVDWDADEVEAQYALHGAQPHALNCGWRLGENLSQECSCGLPTRVLATCAAIRRIVEHGPSQCADYEDQAEYGSHHYPDPEWAFCDGCSAAESVDNNWRWTLQILALPYADHPDYDQTWRP